MPRGRPINPRSTISQTKAGVFLSGAAVRKIAGCDPATPDIDISVGLFLGKDGEYCLEPLPRKYLAVGKLRHHKGRRITGYLALGRIMPDGRYTLEWDDDLEIGRLVPVRDMLAPHEEAASTHSLDSRDIRDTQR